MDIESVFGSYLKTDDLSGKEITVVIAEVKIEDMGSDGMKPVVYFQGATKGLVLNVTRKNQLVALYQAETANWIGKSIILFPGQTTYQGKIVGTIHLKSPAFGTQPVSQPAPVLPGNGGVQPTTVETPPAPVVGETPC